MGRFWLGVGLMASLLALGAWTAFSMDALHSSISDTLQEAVQQIHSGDIDSGIALAQQAHSRWDSHWRRTAAVSDHTPMDEIDSLFFQMESYAASGQIAEFAAHCARLAQRIDAVGDGHQLTWWNLL